MFSNKKEESEYSPTFFFKPITREDMTKMTNALIAKKNEEVKPLHQKYAEMIDWLKTYVNCSEFINSYTEERSLELMAEATFLAVNSGDGLESLINKMGYEQIREIQPNPLHIPKTELDKSIDKVFHKITRAALSYEAGYAIQQAAYCIYIHYHSYEKLKEEEQLYKARTGFQQDR